MVLAPLSFRANVLFFIAMSLLFLGIANENHQYWVMAQETSFQMPSTVGSSFNLYENATFGIKFQFHSTWNKVEILSGRITDIKFVLPVSQNASDTSPISIDIIIEKNLQNITSLDQISRLTDNLLKTTLGSAFQITNDTHATILGGLPAMERSFIVKQSTIGAELGVKQVLL